MISRGVFFQLNETRIQSVGVVIHPYRQVEDLKDRWCLAHQKFLNSGDIDQTFPPCHARCENGCFECFDVKTRITWCIFARNIKQIDTDASISLYLSEMPYPFRPHGRKVSLQHCVTSPQSAQFLIPKIKK